MNPALYTDLRRQLSDLCGGGVLVGIKTGTEAEDMSFEEVSFLRKLTDGLLPLIVKIGGPEARNDIRELINIGVDGLVAPMVESEYALRKFVQALEDIVPEDKLSTLVKGLNLETWQGFNNLDQILQSPAFARIDRITAARSDLSESMGKSPDDREVLETCRQIVEATKLAGRETSLGGSVHPGNIQSIIKNINPDLVNTRNMLMNVEALAEDPDYLLREFLSFEVALYKRLGELPTKKAEVHRERARLVEKRMESIPID